MTVLIEAGKHSPSHRPQGRRRPCVDRGDLARRRRVLAVEIESGLQAASVVLVVVCPASNERIWVRCEVQYGYRIVKKALLVLAQAEALPA